MPDEQSRFTGCLLGLAAGDAVGTTVEFKQPGTFTPLTDMVGGGLFHLKPGQWTDDTSMALCLAESLVQCEEFDPRDQMQRYVRWWHEGYLSSTGACFDIGNTCSAALHHFELTGEPYAGSTEPYSAGNGSIMRLAPVPMRYAFQPVQALEYAAASSRTTHAIPAAVDACRYMAAILVGLLQGATREEVLEPGYTPVPDAWEAQPLTPLIAEVAAGSFKHKQPPEIEGTGYVVRSLEAALWAFYHADTFAHGCLLAANLGHDADTTAAIYGQFAGAYFGLEAIPASWRERLAMADLLTDRATALYTKARAAAPGNP